jgi:hypothetical protein
MAAGSSSGGGSEGIKAGRAYVEIGAKDAGLKAGLESAKKAVLKFGKEVAETGAPILGLGAAVVGPILASLKEVTEHFSAINRASIKTGASTEAISDLGYAAKLSGASLESVESGLKFLDKTMAEAASGSASATEALAQFGVTAEQLKGMDADQKMLAISKGLQAIEESAQGPALRSLMGRGALGLKPMLDNSRELARLLKENGEVGGRVSKEDAENAERVEKAYLKVSAAVKNAFMAIGAAILPEAEAIGHFASMATEAARQVKEFIDANRNVVLATLGISAAVATVGAALVGLGVALSIAGIALGGFTSAAGAMGTVLDIIFAPELIIAAVALGAAVAGLAVALAVVPGLLDDVKDTGEKAWGLLGDTFRTTWQGIKDALAAGDLKLAFEIALAGLDVVWKAFLVTIRGPWADFKEFFVGGWADAIAGIEILWAGVKAGWSGLVGGMQIVFAQFSRFVGDTFVDTIQVVLNLIASAVREVYELKASIEEALPGGKNSAASTRALGDRIAARISGLTGDMKAQGDARTQALEDQARANMRIEGEKARAEIEGIKAARDAAAAARKAAAADGDLAAAAALAAAAMKLRELEDRAKPPPVEAGPMPREVARKAAVEGLGAARGQFGGAGAGYALATSGEAIAKDQLDVQKQIEKNTREGGGIRGY